MNAQSRKSRSLTETLRAGDRIARGIESTVVGLLSAMCQSFAVTPESIKSFKPHERGNAPPPTGGISSLG